MKIPKELIELIEKAYKTGYEAAIEHIEEFGLEDTKKHTEETISEATLEARKKYNIEAI